MNDNIYLAGKTQDNQEVYYTKTKFGKISKEMKNLIAEALPKIRYKEYPLAYSFYFDRIVGSTLLVEIEDYQKERVFWVFRNSNPNWKVPIFIGGRPRMTTYITIIFKKTGDMVFVADAYFGKRALPVPGDTRATKNRSRSFVEKCQEFWQNHALVVPKDAINIDKTINSMNEEEASRFLKCINA